MSTDTARDMAALVTLLAGLLPAFGNRGWLILLLSAASVGGMWWGAEVCSRNAYGFEGFLCIFALIGGGTLGFASLFLGLVRWRYRVHGAETMLGRPWVAGLVLYALAVLGFFGFMGVLSAA